MPLSPDRFDLGAVLLVGDDAIEASRSPSAPFVHPYDLAGEWRNWTGGPLPLCRWIVRKSLPDEQKEELEALVRRSVTEVLKNPGPLLESHIVEHGLSCSVLDAEAWLRSCTYELGPAEERAGSTYTSSTASCIAKSLPGAICWARFASASGGSCRSNTPQAGCRGVPATVPCGLRPVARRDDRQPVLTGLHEPGDPSSVPCARRQYSHFEGSWVSPCSGSGYDTTRLRSCAARSCPATERM